MSQGFPLISGCSLFAIAITLTCRRNLYRLLFDNHPVSFPKSFHSWKTLFAHSTGEKFATPQNDNINASERSGFCLVANATSRLLFVFKKQPKIGFDLQVIWSKWHVVNSNLWT